MLLLIRQSRKLSARIRRRVTAMKTEYRIEPAGTAFILIDDLGEQVDTAVKAHMQMFGVDRETARYWIFSAAEATDR
jgi:hypothetical protein